MSEQFDPGRAGFRGVMKGPTLGFNCHDMAILERYSERWSRLWAISYNPGLAIPDERTLGWWLLAEFKTRQESRIYFTHLSHVWSGRTIEVVTRRRRGGPAPRCPECGCANILSSVRSATAIYGSLTCAECGFMGELDAFTKEPA